MSEVMSKDEAVKLLNELNFPFYNNDCCRENWLHRIDYDYIDKTSDERDKLVQAMHTLFPSKCPPFGTSFIGWKQVQVYSNVPFDCFDAIAKIEIPADARRINSGIVNKCRCERAKVLDIFKIDNPDIHYKIAMSRWDFNFQYIVGEEVVPDWYDSNELTLCGHGIHFFMTPEEAMAYKW